LPEVRIDSELDLPLSKSVSFGAVELICESICEDNKNDLTPCCQTWNKIVCSSTIAGLH
jgi:hypothetical protein